MAKFIDSIFIEEMGDITTNMYRQGWDERNGGNISYLLKEEVRQYFKPGIIPTKNLNNVSKSFRNF